MDFNLFGVSFLFVITFNSARCLCRNQTWMNWAQVTKSSDGSNQGFAPCSGLGDVETNSPAGSYIPYFKIIKSPSPSRYGKPKMPHTGKPHSVNTVHGVDHGFVINFQKTASSPRIFELIFRYTFDNATGTTEFKAELVQPRPRIEPTGPPPQSSHVLKLRQMIETVVTKNPVKIVVDKYPHLANNSVLSKRHIFQHIAVVSGVYMGVCITFHKPCFALIQRLTIVIQNFLSDAVFEIIVDIIILVIIIWVTNATFF